MNKRTGARVTLNILIYMGVITTGVIAMLYQFNYDYVFWGIIASVITILSIIIKIRIFGSKARMSAVIVFWLIFTLIIIIPKTP